MRCVLKRIFAKETQLNDVLFDCFETATLTRVVERAPHAARDAVRLRLVDMIVYCVALTLSRLARCLRLRGALLPHVNSENALSVRV